MKSTKYNRIADNHKASKHIVNNAVIAFITGGFVGLLGEGIIELYIYYFNFKFFFFSDHCN